MEVEEDTKAGETTAGATDTATDMGTDTAIGIATATAGMTDAVRPRPMFAPTDGRTDGWANSYHGQLPRT